MKLPSLDELVRFFQHPVWFVVLVLLVLLCRKALARWWGRLSEHVGDELAARTLGSGRWNRRGLRRYATRVRDEFATFHVPFTEGMKLRMDGVYVPLRHDDDRLRPGSDDMYARVRDEPCTVVLGPPGAGKSMLLRHSMLEWAKTVLGEGRTRRVAVLVRLRACSGDPRPLHAHVAGALKRVGDAGAYLDRLLERGCLTVLFDGLDEVAMADQERVAGELQAWARDHPDGNQMVVTCRSAVYDRRLAEVATCTVEVAPFDEAQMRRFLTGWPWPDISGIPGSLSEGPADGSSGVPSRRETVDELMATLRDAPLIMQLARNPLLLTMIAYLYSGDDEVKLPNSRTVFYAHATDYLLRSKLTHATRFKEQQRRRALQRLALLAHRTAIGREDRLTLPYENVLAELEEVITTRFGGKPEAAEPMLTEIVERTGLLLPVDGGRGFSFAHQTLQEYFAACELADEPDELLRAHAEAPDVWREVVKMWCGVTRRPASGVVREIYRRDRVLAFACVAEAVDLEEELAGEITDWFEEHLGEPGQAAGAEQTIGAFALVAAGPGARGRAVHAFLSRTARTGSGARREAAIAALAATNLPAAAEVLAGLAPDDPKVRTALIDMGNLAIGALRNRAPGDPAAVDDLAAIGTPEAAWALAGLLSAEKPVATRAAWHLGAMLRSADIETALGDPPPDAEPIGGPGLAWVWAPFAQTSPPALTAVAERIAWLLANSADDDVPPQVRADGRLALPLAAVALVESEKRLPAPLGNTLSLFSKEEPSELPDALVSEWTSELSPACSTLVESLNRAQRVSLVARMFGPSGRAATEDDWQRVMAPVAFRQGLHGGLIAALTSALVLVAGVRAVLVLNGRWPWGEPWLAWGVLAAASSMAVIVAMLVLDLTRQGAIGWNVLRCRPAVVVSVVLFLLEVVAASGWLALVTLGELMGWSWAIGVVVMSVGAFLTVFPGVDRDSPGLWSFSVSLSAALPLLAVMRGVVVLTGDWPGPPAWLAWAGIVSGAWLLWLLAARASTGLFSARAALAGGVAIHYAAASAAVGVFAFVTLRDLMNVPLAGAVMAGAVAAGALSVVSLKRKVRRATNPLHGILELQDAPGRTTIIATRLTKRLL
ncbi:NACHT domain-containing protein [Nonomuraea fuscirosea]|uniref:NACHT domain-containing protein n=1 Tax=Nonomuraea fuscirosea TaxID=1291556 RepID=UPI00341C9963